MAFHEVQFPPGISYGSTGGPGWNTNITTVDSGQETRVSRWADARHRYNAVNGVKTLANLSDIKTFFMARAGATHGFRWKDFADFTTAIDGISAHTKDDVQIGVGDATVVTFQLVKKYTSGGITYTRIITKPITGTVLIAFDGIDQPTGWTVDTITGKVTFTSAPGSSVVITAGCEFDVPVRFGEGVDEVLSSSHDFFDTGSNTIDIIELLSEIDVEDSFNYGGAHEFSIAASVQLSLLNGRLQVCQATVTSLIVKLPNPLNIIPGGPILYFVNETGGNTVAIHDHNDNVLIASFTTGSAFQAILSKDQAGTKIWYIF